jgi:hypothetical protein
MSCSPVHVSSARAWLFPRRPTGHRPSPTTS